MENFKHLPKISDQSHSHNLNVVEQIENIIQKMSLSERSNLLQTIQNNIPNLAEVTYDFENENECAENYLLINILWSLFKFEESLSTKIETIIQNRFGEYTILGENLLPPTYS